MRVPLGIKSATWSRSYLIRSTRKLAGYVNTAAGRRAHTEHHRVLALYGIT
jgi:hypothetical protein